MNKLKVLEFEGLAPSVFCGQYFADLNAEVVIIARHQQPTFGVPINQNILNRNKKCICLSLKSNNDIQIIKYLLKDTDVLIDSFRPGVLEKIGLGPADIYKINKKVILLRVSGYGQEGQFCLKPGHDLNYISVSGFLSQIRNNPQSKPSFPNNYLADFAASSLGIMGTMVALVQRDITGEGQIVDCSLMYGVRYLSLALYSKIETTRIEIVRNEGKQLVIFTPQNDQKIQTTVIQTTNLLKQNDILSYENQKFIMKASNPLGFQITNPFSDNKPTLTTPIRGEHTIPYLKMRGVPQNLISESIKLHSKL